MKSARFKKTRFRKGTEADTKPNADVVRPGIALTINLTGAESRLHDTVDVEALVVRLRKLNIFDGTPINKVDITNINAPEEELVEFEEAKAEAPVAKVEAIGITPTKAGDPAGSKSNEIKSLLDPKLTITNDKWAVSYVTCYNKQKEGLDEHTFIVVQSHDKLYKKEIFPSDKNNKIAEIEDDDRQVVGLPLEEMQHQLIRLVKNKKYNTENIADLGHKTWIVDSAKVLRMFALIEDEKKNPPKFSIYGSDSIFKEGEVKARATDIAYVTSGAFGSVIVTQYILSSVIGIDIPPLVAVGIPLVLGGASVVSDTPAGFNKKPYKEEFKAHNCATWCVEKLLSLDAPMINEDLKFFYTDRLAYIGGLHVPVNEDHRSRAKETLCNKAPAGRSCLEYFI